MTVFKYKLVIVKEKYGCFGSNSFFFNFCSPVFIVILLYADLCRSGHRDDGIQQVRVCSFGLPLVWTKIYNGVDWFLFDRID